jgi:hypothetical protein
MRVGRERRLPLAVVIGAGYLGIAAAVGTSEQGHQVVLVGPGKSRRARLVAGELPFREPSLPKANLAPLLVASASARAALPQLHVVATEADTHAGADKAVISTESAQDQKLDWRSMRSLMRNPGSSGKRVLMPLNSRISASRWLASTMALATDGGSRYAVNAPGHAWIRGCPRIAARFLAVEAFVTAGETSSLPINVSVDERGVLMLLLLVLQPELAYLAPVMFRQRSIVGSEPTLTWAPINEPSLAARKSIKDLSHSMLRTRENALTVDDPAAKRSGMAAGRNGSCLEREQSPSDPLRRTRSLPPWRRGSTS